MSSRLSSLLVQDGLVSAKRVADAFQRQVIYGGTLDSNLLELKAVDEDDLIHYLGRADGMPTQPTGINGTGMPLPEVLEVFTKEIAERFHAVPTKLLPGGVLRVLVADGVDLSEFDELAQSVQQRIEPWITLEFRFVEAMDKVYGAGTPSRYARLLARSVQAHQGRDWPPARPIDPLPRFGSLATLRLCPEPPPPPVVPRPPAPAPVDEPTTLMVAPALSAENTASLQIAAAMAVGEPTATMAVPSGSAADTTASLAVPAEPAATEATATMAVPPTGTESTASLAIPPTAEPTASLAVTAAAEPTASLAVPPAAEATTRMEVPPAAEATERMAVPAVTPEPAAAAAQGRDEAAPAQAVPEYLPTVIIDPKSIDRSGPIKPLVPAPSVRPAEAREPAHSPLELDELSIAEWMSAADWLSAANKVDAITSGRSPVPSSRSPVPAAPPELVPQPEAKPAAAAVIEPAAPISAPAAAAAVPAAAAPIPVPAAAPAVVPVVEKSVQLTAATPPQAKPAETKPPQAPPPSRPVPPPAVEAGGRKKGKKGKDGKQQGRQPAPPPAADPRRPQPQAATPTPPAAPPPPAPAVAASPAQPAQRPTQPDKPAAPPAEIAAKAAQPTPSAVKPSAAPPASKSGPVPAITAPSAAAPPAATAKAATLSEPPLPVAPPTQPRSPESAPKQEPAAAAPPVAAAPAKSGPERAAASTQSVPPMAAPTKTGPERAAASAQSIPPVATPAKSGPERAAASTQSVPPVAATAKSGSSIPPVAATAKSGPSIPPVAATAKSGPSIPSVATAAKSGPERAAASTQSVPPVVVAAKSAPERTAPSAISAKSAALPAAKSAGPDRPASSPAPVTAAPVKATEEKPTQPPEAIPEPVNSGRLGEPILVKDPKLAPAKSVPAAAELPPVAASAVSPLPGLGRPPRVATALDAGGFSPISLEAARELAGSVEDRDAIFEALCRGARSRCAFAAVFTLHGEVAFGRVALLDDWLDRAQLGRIAVQLDRPSPFRTAAKERIAFAGTIGAEDASSDPLRALSRSVPAPAAVLPVLVRGRAVALLYLDDEGGELTSAVLDELKPLLADVGQAFLRIAQKNKSGGLGAEPELAAIGEELPAVETSAWRAPSGKSPRTGAAVDSVTTPLPPAAPATAASPVPQVASEQPTVPLRVTPPAAAQKPAAAPPAEAARPAVPDPIHFQPTVPVATKPAAQPAVASSAKSPPGKGDKRSSKLAEATAKDAAAKDAAAKEAAAKDAAAKDAAAKDAAAKDAAAKDAAAKDAAKSAGGKSSLAELIERASNLDETAIDQLLAGGSEAARAVVAALPGPLRSRDRQALGDPVGGPVYSRGPLLALALRMGQLAIEPMLARLADPATPAEARYYLTLCFAEAPVAAAIAPLADCLYDSDDTVRMAAVSALRNFPPHSELATVVSKLRDTVDAGDGKRARFAVEALGEMRISSAVPQLINLLDHEDPALVDAVGRALQTITKQDFGRSRVRWTSWWRRSQDESRLQWLLEGLDHPSAMLRSAAQDELTGLSGDVVGYRFDQPRRDREQARKRWAQWWQRRGYPVL